MKKKILIVDDEEGVRESLKLILEEKYDLTLASDGNECLKSLKANPQIELVLMDIKMPRMNGLEVLRQIKSLNPQMNVVIVTGYRSVETAQEAIKMGAGDYIIKPSIDSSGAKNVFRIQIDEQKICMNGQLISIENIEKIIPVDFLVQEFVNQHDLLKNIYPHSLNTL